MDEGGRWLPQDAAPGHRPRRLDVHSQRRRVQLGAAAEAAGRRGVATPGICSDAGNSLENTANSWPEAKTSAEMTVSNQPKGAEPPFPRDFPQPARSETVV